MAAPKDEALAVAAAQGFGDHGTGSTGDSASTDDATRKRFEHLRALLAFRRQTVHQLADGGYLVASQSWSRECRDLAELEAHARRVGALRS